MADVREVHLKEEGTTNIFQLTKPPAGFWKSAQDDPAFLKKVKCEMECWLNNIDPKMGTFEMSVRCKFSFRWPTGDDLQALGVLPNIRIPSGNVEVSEQRVYQDEDHSTESSNMWMGILSFKLSGYELFEVPEFPFDRQIIDLRVLDFRWLPERNKMDLVELEVKTISRQSQWDPYYAIVEAQKVRSTVTEEARVQVAGRFDTKLRFQRKPTFYVINIFFVAYGILLAGLFPMGLDPDAVADKLAIYAGGMLTLVVFKYGVSDSLPSVPYLTLADYYLMAQIATLVVAMMWALVEYKVERQGWLTTSELNIIDDVLLAISCTVWSFVMLYYGIFRYKKRRLWSMVLAKQEAQHVELQGP